jgi:hypothetical protein
MREHRTRLDPSKLVSKGQIEVRALLYLGPQFFERGLPK